jgi:hypothetical protein
VLETLVKKVVPRAIELYLSGPLQVGEGGVGGKGGCLGGGGNARDLALVLSPWPCSLPLPALVVQAPTEEGDEGYEVVSRAAGDRASLPAHCQQIIHALRAVQAQLDGCQDRFRRAKYAIKQHAETVRQQIGDERLALLLQGEARGPKAMGSSGGSLSAPA